MTMRFISCLLGGALIAGLITTQAVAGALGTTFIDFETDAGLLTAQSPPGIFTGANDNATMNKGVFSDVGTAWLFSSGLVTATSTVTLKIKLNVITDTASGSNNNNADICMFFQSASDPTDVCSACFDGIDHLSTGELIGATGNFNNLTILLPAATIDFTFVYDPVQDKATLSSQEAVMERSVFLALDGATSFYMGLFSTGGPIQLREFTAIGADIPDFPVVGDPLDPANPWVNFSLSSSGTGAENAPFHTLAAVLAAPILPAAMIHIVPGTNSSEKFTGGNEINQNVFLVTAGGGSVSIGVPARRDTALAESGFVSRGGSSRRR